MKYYRNATNCYVGAFSDDLTPPEGSVEVPFPPDNILKHWAGEAWELLSYAQYQALNTYEEWHEYCRAYQKDFRFFRDCIRTNMVPAWETLSAADKKSCAGVFVYPGTFTQQDMDALYSTDEQKANWDFIVYKSIEARTNRFQNSSARASFYLSEINSLDLYTTIEEYGNKFKDTGVPHLYMWMINGAYPPLGIDFTLNGFAQKSYFSTTIRDVVVDIIQNGNYASTQTW